MDGQLSKRHESCQHKLISRYYEGYVTICNKLKDIDLNPLGPWNAPTHLRTLDELEDCLGACPLRSRPSRRAAASISQMLM
jgi:hypothetical protein